jgi:hypothetical protein
VDRLSLGDGLPAIVSGPTDTDTVEEASIELCWEWPSMRHTYPAFVVCEKRDGADWHLTVTGQPAFTGCLDADIPTCPLDDTPAFYCKAVPVDHDRWTYDGFTVVAIVPLGAA